MSKQIALCFMKELLLVKHQKLEIWSNQNRNWSLKHAASPGNLIDVESLLLGSDASLDSSPVIAAVKLVVKGDIKTIGAAYTGNE